MSSSQTPYFKDKLSDFIERIEKDYATTDDPVKATFYLDSSAAIISVVSTSGKPSSKYRFKTPKFEVNSKTGDIAILQLKRRSTSQYEAMGRFGTIDTVEDYFWAGLYPTKVSDNSARQEAEAKNKTSRQESEARKQVQARKDDVKKAMKGEW